MAQQDHHAGKGTYWVIGPTGERLTRNDLPTVGQRWTALRKATVISAISGGMVSIDEMLAQYELTIEELASWQRGFDRLGMSGLHITASQRTKDKIIRDMGYPGITQRPWEVPASTHGYQHLPS